MSEEYIVDIPEEYCMDTFVDFYDKSKTIYETLEFEYDQNNTKIIKDCESNKQRLSSLYLLGTIYFRINHNNQIDFNSIINLIKSLTNETIFIEEQTIHNLYLKLSNLPLEFFKSIIPFVFNQTNMFNC